MTAIQLANGTTVTTDREVIDLGTYRQRGAAAGWRCVCPKCGNVAGPEDFTGAGGDANHAAQECIGRALHPDAADAWWDGAKDGTVKPCDWVAYGLLGTMGRGLLVRMPDGGVVEAFAFADETSP